MSKENSANNVAFRNEFLTSFTTHKDSVHHKVHRDATANFWRTFNCDGKTSPGEGGGLHALPFSLYLPSSKVVVYALAQRADTLALFPLCPYKYSVVSTEK
jgi:hypothetical protein